MPRFGQTEKTIFAIALVMFVAMSYFLYDDSLLFQKNSNNQLTPLGTVGLSENDVRRKNEDTFSWVPTARKDKIYENDSIFTGERSIAELQLDNGAKIKLQPNSLITLNMKAGQMLLDLRYGNIKGEVESGKSITVRSEQEEFVLESPRGTTEKTQLEFSKNHSGNVQVKLLSGKSSLINKKTKAKADLAANKPIQVSQRGEFKPVEKEPAEVLLVSPDKMNFVRETPTSPLPFEWQSKGDIAQFQFDMSPQEDFQFLTGAKITQSKNLQFTDPVEPGTYFWRMKGLDAQGNIVATSKVQSFTVTVAPPAPVIPPPVAVAPVIPPPALPTPPVAPPVVKAPVAPVPPTKPVLVTKNISFKVPGPEARSISSEAAPQLQWKPVGNVKNYQLQITKDQNFAQATNYDIKNTQAAWTDFRPGKYQYRVIARGINGLISEPSDVGTIDITVGDITLNPILPITLIGPKPVPAEVSVAWTEVPFAKKYLAQVSNDVNFTQPAQVEYSTPGGKLTLQDPGTYQIRVIALDENDQPLTAFSNIQEAQYTFRSPLNTPQLTEPFKDASIFLQTEMEPFLWLEWKNVEGAASYTIEISDKANFSRVLISKTQNKNRFLLKDRVPMGKLYWRVRANGITNVETSLWSDPNDFTLHHQKNETFVK